MAAQTERDRLERLLLGQERVMEEVHLLLADEQKQDDLLKAIMLSSKVPKPLRLSSMDAERIYHVDTIRALCVRYRLRFLPGGLFKGPLPGQAVHALRMLERRSADPLSGCMFMAPGERFKLCDSEVDPLLFVPIGGDKFYLVHKWGNDLSAMRAVLNWPVRNVLTLSFTVFVLAVLMALLIPTGLINGSPGADFWGPHRLFAMFWTSMVFGSFTVFGWFAFFGQFSAEAWNSRYFN